MCLFYLWYSYTKPNLIITIHEDLFLLNITRPSAAQYWLQSLEGYHGYVLAIDIMKYALANQTLFFLNDRWDPHVSESRQTSDISRTLVGNKIVDHSDVVGAAPALLQLLLHSRLKPWLQWTGRKELHDETRIN